MISSRIKKIFAILLRISGWILVIFALYLVVKSFYFSRIKLYGHQAYGMAHYVVYQEFVPAGMRLSYEPDNVKILCCGAWWFLAAAAMVLVSAFLAAFFLKKLKLFPKARFLDLVLVFAVINALLAVNNALTEYSAALARSGKLVSAISSCRSTDDCRKICGEPVFSDAEPLAPPAFVYLQNDGFAPGRQLDVFAYDKPAVYLFVWSKDGKIIHIDWCYRAAVGENAPWLKKSP